MGFFDTLGSFLQYSNPVGWAYTAGKGIVDAASNSNDLPIPPPPPAAGLDQQSAEYAQIAQENAQGSAATMLTGPTGVSTGSAPSFSAANHLGATATI